MNQDRTQQSVCLPPPHKLVFRFLTAAVVVAASLGAASTASAAGSPPALAKSYTGSAHNVTASQSGGISLTVSEIGAHINGTFSFQSPLVGSGPFAGSVTSTSVNFTVKPTASTCPSCTSIVFTGTFSPLVSMSGTWVAHLTSGATQSGTWQVGSTWTGTYDDTSQNIPGHMTLAKVVETANGTVGGLATFVWSGGNSTGTFTGSVHGSAVKMAINCCGGAFTFIGKVSSTALGGMSGSYTGTENGTWQVRRAGVAAAI